MQVSPFGYGKVLYLKLNTGEIAVYGHLQRFAPKIETRIKRLQKKLGRYSVKAFFSPNQIPVRQGEVVAYSGRTGIGAPHLHFELRDKNNNPFNPLLKYASFRDRIPPTVTGLAVIPFGRKSQVEGEPLPKVFSVEHRRGNRYFVRQPIQVWGNFGLAVTGFDRTARIHNKCSFYQIRLKVDGKPIFRTEYNFFSFDQTREIVFDRNFRLNRWVKKHYNNLFLVPPNHLPFYNPGTPGTGIFTTVPEFLANYSNSGSPQGHGILPFFTTRVKQEVTGFTKLFAGRHRFEITAKDFSGNAAVLTGELRVGRKSVSPVNGIRLKDSVFIQKAAHSLSVKKIFMDDFVLIRLKTKRPALRKLHLIYNTRFRTVFTNLIQTGLNRFEATISLDSIAGAFTLLSIQGDSGKMRFPIDFIRVFKIDSKNEREIPISRDGTQIRFLKNAAYQPVYFRFEKLPLRRALRSIPGDSITYLLKLAPTDIPLRRGAVLSVHVPQNEDRIKQLAIYASSRNKWHFQGNRFDPERRTLEVPLRDFGEFTILRDTAPPVILRLVPHPGEWVDSVRPLIRADFKDNLSGIADEESIRLTLDGQKCIAEYDPEMNRITYKPDTPLRPGRHKATLQITDRSANAATKSWSFFIRKK
ncbi:peptidase family M23 [bacterium BMS3Abin05]|nr:peptidase family M23 [bacterium BMS3Abin05]